MKPIFAPHHLLFLLCCLMTAPLAAQAPQSVVSQQALPKVFILGEHESAYEQLNVEYQTLLLSACGDDMKLAFKKWRSMLEEMEVFADEIDYEIKGIQLWLNVFWNNDGSIEHIAFHLKPSSRNVDVVEVAAFLSSFMNHYKFPLVYDDKFTHYGSAAFPVSPRRVDKKKLNTPPSHSGDAAPDANQNLAKDSTRNND